MYFPRLHIRVRKMFVSFSQKKTILIYPANTKLLYNIRTTSAKRFRRWSNIFDVGPTL